MFDSPKIKVPRLENVFGIIITFICRTWEFSEDRRLSATFLFVFSLVDNLPCATKFQNDETQEKIYEHGYRLGMYSKQSDETYLNNHLIIKLFYHKESE